MTEVRSESEDRPEISIIIPFQNNRDEVVSIVSFIREQNRDLQIQIICVDNGSDDGRFFDESFLNKQIVIQENKFLQSPYSARNRGIEKATGSVLVFADANSIPVDGWLKQGLRCMRNTHADIVAGNVGFDFGVGPNTANVTDAITSIDQKKSVQEREVAFTANLFVKRTVFESVGLFEEGVRSGGDVRWTKKATSCGHRIAYCPDSTILKKARSFRSLLNKRIRTGKGYLYTWLNEEKGNVWFYNFFRSLKPPSPNKPVQLYRYRYGESLPVGRWKVWTMLYVMGIVEQLSFMAEYLRYNLGSSRYEVRNKTE